MNTPFRIATDAPGLDIGLLHYRDRAVLRILDRAEAATARQLAILVYGHRRIAQRRLLRLWQAGLLERAIVAHAQRGGAELGGQTRVLTADVLPEVPSLGSAGLIRRLSNARDAQATVT